MHMYVCVHNVYVLVSMQGHTCHILLLSCGTTTYLTDRTFVLQDNRAHVENMYIASSR